MRLTENRIAVEVIEPSNTSATGIVLNVEGDEPSEGIVKGVGPGKRTEEGTVLPMSVKVGDHVLFSAGGGLPVRVGGETLHIFKEDEIFAVLED